MINIDWSILIRLRSHTSLRAIYRVVGSSRMARLESLPDNVMPYNLARGIPYGDGDVDAVYHSHMLEHLDRSAAPGFFREIMRVLKPGGVHRAAVPDFEWLCRSYLADTNLCADDPGRKPRHEEFISEIIEQMVRKIPRGTDAQPPLRRSVELALLGDARRRSETHQWMYDAISLSRLFEEVGFVDVQRAGYNQSSIEGWQSYGLEVDTNGHEYKPHSLYIEGRRPGPPAADPGPR